MADCSDKVDKKQLCENHEKCIQMIQAVLDGSATDEEMEHFRVNMDECIPCIEGYNLEKSIKETLKNKVEKKCCPQSTLDLLKSRIGIASLIALSLFIDANILLF